MKLSIVSMVSNSIKQSQGVAFHNYRANGKPDCNARDSLSQGTIFELSKSCLQENTPIVWKTDLDKKSQPKLLSSVNVPP